MSIPVITLGRRLAMAREDAGISVNEMAERLGVDRRTITRYERNKGVAPKAVRIAYQVICDVPEDFIDGRASITQEVLSSRCMTQLPLWGHYAANAA